MTDPIAEATMLVRRPVAEVFDAFVNPDTITKFWLEATTGPLARGARVSWRFMVPGATEVVTVTRFEPQRLIAFDWSDGVAVSLRFEDRGKSATRVTAQASGFPSEHALEGVVGATEGFTIVLCDLKTLLETGRSANLVRDAAELIASS
jgi:uncharacterized protein YndB with AHSA1/START domain